MTNLSSITYESYRKLNPDAPSWDDLPEHAQFGVDRFISTLARQEEMTDQAIARAFRLTFSFLSTLADSYRTPTHRRAA